MAAGAKYVGIFYDRYGRVVTVFLTVANYTGMLYPLQLGSDPVHIKYKGEDGDALQTMIPSEASIQLLFKDDGSPLQEDIFTMDEDTFGVNIVVRNSDLSIVTSWQGWLVPDNQTRTFSASDQSVTLKAIDVLTRLKGQKMTDSNGAYISGPNSLKYYVDNCFAGCFTGSSTMTYNITVLSDMVISNTTTTTLPSILEQLGTYAEAFNDSDGRPLTAYDVVEGIASSLNMRVFYENLTIYFIDNLKYAGLPSTYPITSSGTRIKGVDGAGEDIYNIAIENSENITTLQTYKETSCKFGYKNAVGLLNDGYMINWTDNGSGWFYLTQWYYNPYLTFRPHTDSGRQGSGRMENPYGILLKYSSTVHPTAPPLYYENRMFDVVSTKTSRDVSTGQKLHLNVTFRIPNPTNIVETPISPTPISGNRYERRTVMPIWIALYNKTDVTKSYIIINGQYIDTDFTSTDFELIGKPDWIKVFGDYDAAINPGSYEPNVATIGGNLYTRFTTELKIATVITDINVDTSTQSFTYDFPDLPIGFTGEVYVFLHPQMGVGGVDIANSGCDTIFFNAILTADVEKVFFGSYKGEIQYITRDLTTSSKGDTKELLLNTTVNFNVAGSLFNAIPYVESSVTIDAGKNLLSIALKGAPEPLLSGVTLMKYNAIAKMYLNYAQYKIDFKTVGKVNVFYNYLQFPSLYDSTKPYTSIYNIPYIQTASDYNVKQATRQITAVSMKTAIRHISKDTLDDTNDFSEFYYLS